MVYPNANISPKQANNSIKKERGATPSLLKPKYKIKPFHIKQEGIKKMSVLLIFFPVRNDSSLLFINLFERKIFQGIFIFEVQSNYQKEQAYSLGFL